MSLESLITENVDGVNDNEHDIQSKYVIMSEIDHVLKRPDTWVGSTINEMVKMPIYFPSKNLIKLADNCPYNEALNKLVDEVFSNSVDEYRRSKSHQKSSLFDITNIRVRVNTNGNVCIEDDGGIPIIKHKVTGVYIPFMIFGMLRTSSNYDDNQSKEWIGKNGLGAKLSNIYSTEFTVETADGSKYYKCTWKNNMTEYVEDEIVESTDHFTRISYTIDLPRFELENFDVGNIRIFQKRCIDTAAANPGLIIHFESDAAEGKLDSSWKFDNFNQYFELYLNDDEASRMHRDRVLTYQSKKDTIIICFGTGLNDMAFVNGALCNEGSHITKVHSQIVQKIMEFCKKEDMELITEKDIISRVTVFINCTIFNPKYDGQTKTKLSSKIDHNTLKMDEKFLNSLRDSELMVILRDYYDIKYREQKKKELSKLNKDLKKTEIKKLIKPAIKDAKLNELLIFEGDSASKGFQRNRNLYQAAYLLRGKIMNVLNLSREEQMQNQELKEILAGSNLMFGDSKHNLKNSNFSKYIFFTDQDYDGYHISGLLLCFFAINFPELIKDGRVYRGLSPIVIATKGSEKRYYHNLTEYHKDVNILSGYHIKYNKGLGGLTNEDYKEMLNNMKLIQFDMVDQSDLDAIYTWFDKSTTLRKDILIEENRSEDIK
jgi:DNA topoisomerase-2